MYNSDYFNTLIDHDRALGYAWYMYNTVSDPNEHFNDIIADGYFNQVNIDNPGTLLVNDVITVCALDGYGNFIVSAVSPDVVLVVRQ
jgi:hypothetical protein